MIIGVPRGIEITSTASALARGRWTFARVEAGSVTA